MLITTFFSRIYQLYTSLIFKISHSKAPVPTPSLQICQISKIFALFLTFPNPQIHTEIVYSLYMKISKIYGSNLLCSQNLSNTKVEGEKNSLAQTQKWDLQSSNSAQSFCNASTVNQSEAEGQPPNSENSSLTSIPDLNTLSHQLN